jgi:glycosyltransferase involved in cell wall biosynthesis
VNETLPLVTVGIPTYNRVDRLPRAVESVLAQDYASIELLIADNASTDGTAEYVDEICAAHPHARSLRSATNVGATANFNRVRRAAAGEYFMWLGDDDWLDPDYVSTCVRELRDDPELVLVAGSVVYHDDDEERAGLVVQPQSGRATQRVLEYYRTTKDNGVFYGIVPRVVIERTPEMRNEMGNDMHYLAAVAYQGRFRVTTTRVHRATGGLTASLKRAAQTAGMPWWQGEYPQLAIAWFGFSDIAWRSPVYRDLGVRRVVLGARAAWIVLWRFVPHAIPKYVRVLRDRARPKKPGEALRRRAPQRGRNG